MPSDSRRGSVLRVVTAVSHPDPEPQWRLAELECGRPSFPLDRIVLDRGSRKVPGPGSHRNEPGKILLAEGRSSGNHFYNPVNSSSRKAPRLTRALESRLGGHGDKGVQTVMPNAILCDHCEALNPTDCRNCQQCGRELFRPCRSCGEPVARYYTRCPNCRRSTGRGAADGGQDLVGRPEYSTGLVARFFRKMRRLAGGGS